MMNQNNIKRILTRLSKDDFELLVPIVLRAASGMTPVCVDGSNDGSVDYHLYEGARKSCMAVQTTDVWQNIKCKIKKDVRSIKDKKDIRIYYMMVKDVVSNDVKERLEGEALSEYGIIMKILGGNEVSSWIIAYGLEGELCRIARLECDAQASAKLRQPEVLLHTYLSMSSDCRDLNLEMIDSTLKFLLHTNPKQSKQDLVLGTLRHLHFSEMRQNEVSGRIDSLSSKGVLEEEGGIFDLSTHIRKEINILVSDYDAELSLLSDVCSTTIKDMVGCDIVIDDQREFATLLARCYVAHYCDVVRRADYDLKIEIFNNPVLYSALDQIKAILLKKGIAPSKVDGCVKNLILTASSNQVIKRLAQSVVYVAVREFSGKKSPAVFNTNDWSSITVFTDASALMPYLISSVFEPHDNIREETRLSVNAIQKVNCRVVTPSEYIDESAAHLIAARWYWENIEGFESELEFVPNAYVSSYYRLKNQGVDVPSTLKDFLTLFCDDLFRFDSERYSYKSVVRSSLARLSRDYGVEIVKFENNADEIDSAFAEQWKDHLRKKKSNDVLIRHDADVIKNIYHKTRSELGRNVLLTWDNALLRAEYDLRKDFWIVSPVDMADLVGTSSNEIRHDLLSLSHSIASVVPPRKELSYGHILDRIIMMCRDRKMDWQCRLDIQKIRDEFFNQCENLDSKSWKVIAADCEKRTVDLLGRAGFTDEEENEYAADGADTSSDISPSA